MKSTRLGILLLALAGVSMGHRPGHDNQQHHKKPDRLCPDGYFYVSDDFTAKDAYWTEEVDRSPVYSCYKISKQRDTWAAANLKCIEEQAQLVSFETVGETLNFCDRAHHFNIDSDDETIIMTSGVHFSSNDNEGWWWVGSNVAIHANWIDRTYEEGNATADGSCLGLVISNEANKTMLVPVDCLEQKYYYACEARVQTVTYYAWFVANWFTFLLIFLLIVMVLSLCVSVSMYSQKQNRQRVYRGQARQMVNPDLPPSYSETTGNRVSEGSRLDHYRNKGREMLSRVYQTRDGRKVPY